MNQTHYTIHGINGPVVKVTGDRGLAMMDMVHVGNNVVVKDLEFDETLHYQIVGSQEADPMNGRISEDSPFGRALLGKKAGEEVVVEAPAGNIRYQIVEIQR